MKRDVIYDEFGNPSGEAYDLGGVDDVKLQGEKILLYVGYGVPGIHHEKYEWHHAQQAVAQRHLQMDILYAKSDHQCALDKSSLTGYSQLWFVSNQHVTLNNEQLKFICDFVRDGNGLLIWADNQPYYADANVLAKELIGTEFSGNKHGDQILVPSKELRLGHFIDHPLTQGINQLYEGITISTIRPVKGLTILGQSHDGQNCIACFEKGKQRIVLDTGFTKLYENRFHRTAGTARYFRNIAFWLAHGARDYEYIQFTPGRERIATINPHSTSECYAYEVKKPTTLTYILHWQRQAKLGIEVKNPKGRVVQNVSSDTSPIRLEIPASMIGSWHCWIRGVNVPRSNFPYVLTLAVKTEIAQSTDHSHSVRRQPMEETPLNLLDQAELVDEVVNYERRCAVVLLLDTSYSMQGQPIAELNKGLRVFKEELMKDDTAKISVEVAIITFGQEVKVIDPRTGVAMFPFDAETAFVPAMNFQPPTLTVNGNTPMGEAIRQGLDLLRKRKDFYESQDLDKFRPWMFLITDGEPNDPGWESTPDMVRQTVKDKGVVFFAVGVQQANMTILKRFADHPAKLKGLAFRELFRWLSSSLKSVSQSKPGQKVSFESIDPWREMEL